MGKGIIHKGTIVKSSDGIITVRFASDGDDCSGCAVARICGKGENMDIPYPGADASLTGHRVEIFIDDSTRRKGMLLMFAMPVILIIAVLAVALAFGVSEGQAALISLGVVAIWLAIVYKLRRRIEPQSPFTVKLLD